MGYGALADVVAIIHLLAIVTMLFGGFLAWRWPRVIAVHAPVAAVIGGVFLLGVDCPLTALEQHLRTAAGEASYSGGYLDHYLVGPLTGHGATPALRTLELGVAVGFNLLAYGVLAVRWAAPTLITRRRAAPAAGTDDQDRPQWRGDPPATAGMTVTVEPAGTGVDRPSAKRTSSSST